MNDQATDTGNATGQDSAVISLDIEKGIIEKWKETDDFKKLLQSNTDRIYAHKLKEERETWEQIELPKKVEAAINEKFPPKSEAEKRLAKIESELADEKRARKRAELREGAIKKISGLDSDIDAVRATQFIYGDDEEQLSANIDMLVEFIKDYGIKQVKKILKSDNVTPGSPSGNPKAVWTKREDLVGKSKSEIISAVKEGRVQIPGIDTESLKNVL